MMAIRSGSGLLTSASALLVLTSILIACGGGGGAPSAVVESTDGRFVLFRSSATNLVTDDMNGMADVFVHDRTTGETTRVSVDNAGVSFDLSSDGRFVVFASLVAGDVNGVVDIFVHDRTTDDTTRVSVDSAGNEGNASFFNPALSADGRFVAFRSSATNLVTGDTNGVTDVFVHDRVTGETTRVSVSSAGVEGDNRSFNSALSADGRFVAFDSDATNLVAGDLNGVRDVFVHDRVTGETTRVSVDSAGMEGDDGSFNPALSADGRFVAFESEAANLVTDDTQNAFDVFVHDRVTGETARVSVSSGGDQGDFDSFSPVLSADGRIVVFTSDATNLVAGDTNGVRDVFAHDRMTGETMRVSVDNDGNEGNFDSSTSE